MVKSEDMMLLINERSRKTWCFSPRFHNSELKPWKPRAAKVQFASCQLNILFRITKYPITAGLTDQSEPVFDVNCSHIKTTSSGTRVVVGGGGSTSLPAVSASVCRTKTENQKSRGTCFDPELQIVGHNRNRPSVLHSVGHVAMAMLSLLTQLDLTSVCVSIWLF